MLEINRASELKSTIEAIQHRWGQSAIQRLKTASFESSVLSSGLESLDNITSIGGLPRGITSFYGTGSSGIVTLALFIMAYAQKRGHIPVFFDLGSTFDAHYAQRCGLDVSRLLVVRPHSLDEGYKIAYDLVESNTTRLIVLDYISEMDATRSMQIAANLSQRLANRANAHPCAILCLVSNYSISSVKPLAQNSALDIQVRMGRWYEVAGEVAGYTLNLKVLHNRFAPAGQSISQHLKLMTVNENAS